jgi:molybdopterin/thiamine biosynthesis adenylyltransferase
MNNIFNYDIAFKRNIGLITTEESSKVSKTKIALAGLGGLGGYYFLSLVRMGFQHFSIADLDDFELKNFNRQLGANMDTIGQPKVDAMVKMAKLINPDISVRVFPKGLQKDNSELFMEEADIVVDAIDFFCLTARELLYNQARKKKRPVFFAAPLGFSGAMVNISPDGMSFHEYYSIYEGQSSFDKIMSFAIGLAPSGLHLKYFKMNPSKISQGDAPSLTSACLIASGLVTTEVINFVLARKEATFAPQYSQLEPLRGVWKRKKLGSLRRHTLQKLKLRYMKSFFGDKKEDFEKLIK